MQSSPEQAPQQDIHLQTTRIRFPRVLVASDFSKHSDAALETAIAIATLFNSKLFLFHSGPPIVYGAGFEPIMPEVVMGNLEVAKASMENQMAAFPELKSLAHEVVITEGPLIERINDLVATHKIDLIVAGSHGAHGLEKLAFGSTAELLLRQAICPVLVVGPYARRSIDFKSIVLATDLGIDSFRSAQYAAALAEELQSQFTVMHVIEEKKAQGSRKLLAIQASEKLFQLLPADAENWCHPKITVEHGDVSEKILRVAQREKADLIVLGVHEHGFWADHETWRTLTKVIQRAPCAVLSVRGHIHDCRDKRSH